MICLKLRVSAITVAIVFEKRGTSLDLALITLLFLVAIFLGLLVLSWILARVLFIGQLLFTPQLSAVLPFHDLAALQTLAAFVLIAPCVAISLIAFARIQLGRLLLSLDDASLLLPHLLSWHFPNVLSLLLQDACALIARLLRADQPILVILLVIAAAVRGQWCWWSCHDSTKSSEDDCSRGYLQFHEH